MVLHVHNLQNIGPIGGTTEQTHAGAKKGPDKFIRESSCEIDQSMWVLVKLWF